MKTRLSCRVSLTPALSQWERGISSALRAFFTLTKDADFSDRALVSLPPLWVVHFRFGNMRMRDFHGLLTRCWPRVQEICQKNRLVRVYADRIEAIE